MAFPRLEPHRELAQRRSVLSRHLDVVGSSTFAEELEPFLLRAAEGHRDGREVAIALTSWVAHTLATHGRSPLIEVAEIATQRGLALTSLAAKESRARKALARRGRLAEVGVARWQSIVPFRRREPNQSAEDWRAQNLWFDQRFRQRFGWMGAPGYLERRRAHHEPDFIGRLLDHGGCRIADAVVIAARRPTTLAMVLAIATRDRWFSEPRVQEALIANPFTPPALLHPLSFAASDVELASLASRIDHPTGRAASAILAARHHADPARASEANTD
jgi:hypothetical protein